MLNSNLTIAHHPIPIKMGGSDPKKVNIFHETPSLLIINGRRVTSVSDYSDDKRGASSFRRLLRLPCLCFFYYYIDAIVSFPGSFCIDFLVLSGERLTQDPLACFYFFFLHRPSRISEYFFRQLGRNWTFVEFFFKNENI